LADCAAFAKITSVELIVNPHRRVLNVEPGANLLEELRSHGVQMSHSCRAGRCGTCRCKVVAGDVLDGSAEMQRPLDRGLQTVLACQTFLTEPCTIEIPEPDEIVVHPTRTVKATVAAVESITHDVKRLLLKVAKPLEYSPGQHVNVQLAPGLVRPYSPAGWGERNELEFFIRVVNDGRAGHHLKNSLNVGDPVRVSGPLGTAYLRRQHRGPMLCVAGGTGLAPVLSIVRAAIAAGMRNPIHLYFGVRLPRDTFGIAVLQQLQERHEHLHVHVAVSSAAQREHRAGLVTDAIRSDLKDLREWRAYLFGSPPLVETTSLLLRRLQMPPERIYAEAFYVQ
jgi:ferredoxin-NAD(P)+ reductase (naphthalene dioxygenase ferredoxin-specific)